jgi:hypothetical protein
MKNSFRKTLTIFKYLAILFTVLSWVYMVYDDFIFIKKYGLKLEYIGLWSLWFLGYFLVFTIYFWGISLLGILKYHKIYKHRLGFILTNIGSGFKKFMKITK